MDEQEYLRAADACLERAARWLEELEDLDVSTSDGLVTIEFDDGARFVLNRQSAARQMWLAAGTRAWHYGWDAGRSVWVDDRDGHELFARLAEVVGQRLGVDLAPPAA
jgi:CyaY protein